MPQYMLLLYDDPSGWHKLSPEEMQKAIEKYMAWTKKPFTVDSKRLAGDPGRVIRAQGGRARDRWTLQRNKEGLGGFYTIEAASYEEAIQRCARPSAPGIRRHDRSQATVRNVSAPTETGVRWNTCSGARRAASSRTLRGSLVRPASI